MQKEFRIHTLTEHKEIFLEQKQGYACLSAVTGYSSF